MNKKIIGFSFFLRTPSLSSDPWNQRWAATLNYATQPLSRVATAATLCYATLQRF
ncbi:hypothetical protein PCANC_18975 [Puccinia coronata f. sp. avenae]|uniref:Uncharacterized protein n=1 Tax=Puccinia coronata f. sp. avenae TaxID=200324 RepID=A0A2N5ST65_9BASI|nr:hypothetical protein PCANC_18975 [Puccinia coronata f. sp. avenae]